MTKEQLIAFADRLDPVLDEMIAMRKEFPAFAKVTDQEWIAAIGQERWESMNQRLDEANS